MQVDLENYNVQKITLEVSNVFLKGEKGETGAQGIQGIQGEQGARGEQGLKGDKGEKGDTPIKTVDYWTEEDKSEIKAYCDEYINEKITSAIGGAY